MATSWSLSTSMTLMSLGQYLTGIDPRRLISEAADGLISIIFAKAVVPPARLKMSSTVFMAAHINTIYVGLST